MFFNPPVNYKGDSDLNPENFNEVASDDDIQVGDLVGFWEHENGWWWFGLVLKPVPGNGPLGCVAKVLVFSHSLGEPVSIIVDECCLVGGKRLNYPMSSNL